MLREGESEFNGNPNENLSTPVSAILPSEFSGTRTLSLRGSRSLLPVSSSVEDPEIVTSRLDQEQGIRIGVCFLFLFFCFVFLFCFFFVFFFCVLFVFFLFFVCFCFFVFFLFFCWLRIFDTDTIDVENLMFLVNQT